MGEYFAVLTSMFNSDEQRRREELLILTLAKLYIVLELSAEACPLCHNALTHDPECPVTLAWSLLNNEQQREARRALRSLALALGYDEASWETIVH